MIDDYVCHLYKLLINEPKENHIQAGIKPRSLNARRNLPLAHWLHLLSIQSMCF